MPIKIAIGLGNSESQYARTRHNVGEILVRGLAADCGAGLSYDKYANAYVAKCSLAGVPLVLAFAKGYMNLSGQNLKNILRFFKFDISEVLVIYDDITMDAGKMKLSMGGSAGGHNGVDDIIKYCGNSFLRLKIGIGAKPDKRMNLADYVLGAIPDNDLALIKGLKVRDCVATVLTKGADAAQNIFNRREPKAKKVSKPVSDVADANQVGQKESAEGSSI